MAAASALIGRDRELRQVVLLVIDNSEHDLVDALTARLRVLATS